MDLTGASVLVTGGASGLGWASARRLAEAIVDNPMLNGETIRLDGAQRMTPR